MRNAQTFLRMETPPLRVGMCPLRMETPPLRVGSMPFAYGNAAARTFGRAHRRRPYHFSCGFVSQGRRRGARRWTNMRNVCWRGARRRTKSKMIAGEVLADGLKREKVAGEQFADGQKQEMIAGEVLAADIPHCLSQERCSPPIIRVVYRRKIVRRRYSALFIAGKEFAADNPCCLS